MRDSLKGDDEMQHSRFKSEQTAAVYVANGLDEQTLEAFELHMMSCPECVTDVEVWQLLRSQLPEVANEMTDEVRELPSASQLPADAAGSPRSGHVHAAPAAAAKFATPSAMSGWRLAASFGAVAVVAGLGGWFGQALRGPAAALQSGEAAVYNLPPTMRGGADCVRLPPGEARVVLLRVPGAQNGTALIALDMAGRALDAGDFSVRTQADGSWLAQFPARALRGNNLTLSVKNGAGSIATLGCVSGG